MGSTGEITPRITVVIPLYNEVDSVAAVLAQLTPLASKNNWEVIVVDDCSTDESWQLVQDNADVLLIRHTRNRGYGAARVDSHDGRRRTA